MPRVDIVQKHNTAARRLFIRGHNGKIYPYLVVNDSGLGDARREERVLQLLRMLNHYLGKQKVAPVTCPNALMLLTEVSWAAYDQRQQ
jgi:transformation/transcription domain-associated protein